MVTDSGLHILKQVSTVFHKDIKGLVTFSLILMLWFHLISIMTKKKKTISVYFRRGIVMLKPATLLGKPCRVGRI